MSRTAFIVPCNPRISHRPLVTAVREALRRGALLPVVPLALAAVSAEAGSATLGTTPWQPGRQPSAVVFIDPRVSDHERLLAGLRIDARAVMLEPERDGLAQVAEAVHGMRGLQAIHLISHGAPGSLQLGATELTEANLPERVGELAIIREALAEDGDLLLYGCEVGRGAVGERFVAALSLVTGADLAASDDLTGHAELDGDWELEVRRGDVDADVPIDSVARRQWRAVLPFSGTINFSNVSNAGNYKGDASVNAAFDFGSYTLVADGADFGTGTYAYAGNAYLATSYGACPSTPNPPLGEESKLTLSFQGNETFDATSIQLYHFNCPGTSAQTFTITSDQGDSVTSPSLGNRTGLNTVSLSGFTGITKLYITPSSGAMGLLVDNLQVANVAPAGDSTPPTVAITRDDASPTNAGSVAFSVDFSEDVTNVDQADFVVATGGSAGGSLQSVTGSSPNFTATVASISGDGSLELDIAGGTDIQDTAGNDLNQTPTTDESYIIDNTGPSITDTDAGQNNVDEGAINGTVVGGLTIASGEGTPSLTDNAGGRFQLVGAQVQVVDGSLLDAETASSHQIEVEASDALGNDSSQTFTIAVNDLAPTFAIAADNADKPEGDSGATNFTFTISRGTDTTGTGSVAYAVGGAGTANAADFGGALPSGTQTFADGSASEILTIQVAGDTGFEPDEGFTVTLSNPSDGGSITGASAAGTILNDDPASVDIAVTKTDGQTAAIAGLPLTYTIVVSNAGPQADPAVTLTDSFPAGLTDVSFTSVAADGATGNTASGAGDLNETLSMPAGSSVTYSVTATIAPDFTGTLINTASAVASFSDSVPGNNSATDNDTVVTAPSLTLVIADASISETGSTTATVSRNGATTPPLTVALASDDTSEAMVPSQVTIPAGLTSAPFTINGVDDPAIDGTQTVTITAIATNYTDGTDSLDVTDDDASLSIAATDAAKAEGNSGDTNFRFTVTRTGATDADSSATYSVAGLSADADDFGGSLPSGNVSFSTGETSQFIDIAVSGDTDVEPDETFTVSLSAPVDAFLGTSSAQGTIVNDDELAISIADATDEEGQTLGFTISIDGGGSADAPISFTYSTTTGTAGDGDFTEVTDGAGQIDTGQSSTLIQIATINDDVYESDETFSVSLADISGANGGDTDATGTITDNDPLPIEIGRGLFDSACANVDLGAGYTSPVVILGPPTDFDPAPLVARVCTATAAAFEARLQEWPSEDGLHGVEELAFLAGEAGRYELGDGSFWELGRFNLDGAAPASVSFSSAFPDTPALFLSLQTENDAAPAVVRASGLGSGGFTATLQEEEASVGVHAEEQVGYLAVYPANAVGTLPIDIGVPYQLVSPPLALDETPVVIGKTDLYVQEETSADAEIDHALETVVVLRIGDGGKDLLAQDVSLTDADTAALRQLGWDEDEDGLADTNEIELLGTDPDTANEVVAGDGGNNSLTGTAGDDVMIPGIGQDTVTTGAGADRVVYTSREDAGDRILDFTVGEDLLVLGQLLDAAGYTGDDPIGDGYVQIVGSPAVSVVRFDVDGSGPTPAFIIAILMGVPVADMSSADNFEF